MSTKQMSMLEATMSLELRRKEYRKSQLSAIVVSGAIAVFVVDIVCSVFCFISLSNVCEWSSFI